jgi:hypothetical protein
VLAVSFGAPAQSPTLALVSREDSLHDLARHETPELNDRLGHLAQVLKNAFRLDPVFRIVIVLRVGVAWDDKGIEEPEKWLKLVFYS